MPLVSISVTREILSQLLAPEAALLLELVQQPETVWWAWEQNPRMWVSWRPTWCDAHLDRKVGRLEGFFGRQRRRRKGKSCRG